MKTIASTLIVLSLLAGIAAPASALDAKGVLRAAGPAVRRHGQLKPRGASHEVGWLVISGCCLGSRCRSRQRRVLADRWPADLWERLDREHH